MSKEKTARLLDLVAYLSTHRAPVSRREICRAVKGYRESAENGVDPESVRKAFVRDIDDLRSWGIDVQTKELGHNEPDDEQFGYTIGENHLYMPYIVQDGDETRTREPYHGLQTISLSTQDLRVLDRATRRLLDRSELPLGRSVRSLRRKFEFDVPLSDDAMESFAVSTDTNETARSLNVLQKGIVAERAVSLEYHSMARDEVRERVVEPYGLFLNWGKWYCVARPEEKETEQVFRVDRMSGARCIDSKKFFVPDDFSVSTYTGRPPWALSNDEGTPVDVRFDFPESRWVLAQGLGEVVEDVDKTGGAVIRFDVRTRNPFIRWILRFRGHATIESPATIAAALDEMKQRIRKLYEADNDG